MAYDQWQPNHLLGKLIGANFNSTADQAIVVGANVLITDIIVGNASTSLTTAQGGFYAAASKAGTAIVATNFAYSPCTGATLFVKCTLAIVVKLSTLFLSLTQAQGAPATADVYVMGLDLNIL